MVIKVVENENGDGIDLMPLLRPQTNIDSSITLKPVINSSITLKPNINRSITLEEIVFFLKKEGVKKIIIFDLTCSAMLSPDGDHLNATSDGQRTIRADRRRAIKENLGGKKTKKRRRGKKNKKNKIKSRKHRK